NHQQLRSIAHHAAAVADLFRQPFLVLEGLTVKKANKAFYDVFGYSPGVVENRPIHEVGDGRWKLSGLRGLVEDVLAKDGNVEDFQIPHEIPQRGRRTLHANACRLRGMDGNEDIVFV